MLTTQSRTISLYQPGHQGGLPADHVIITPKPQLCSITLVKVLLECQVSISHAVCNEVGSQACRNCSRATIRIAAWRNKVLTGCSKTRKSSYLLPECHSLGCRCHARHFCQSELRSHPEWCLPRLLRDWWHQLVCALILQHHRLPIPA